MLATTLGLEIERVMLQFVRLENWYPQCVLQQKGLSHIYSSCFSK
jgi:hypothetical protein